MVTPMMSQTARRTIRYGLLKTPLPVRSRVEVGLLRAYETYARARHATEEPLECEGLPVPPAKLRVLVCGSADPEYFLDAGERHAAFFRGLLERNGVQLQDTSAILDFGVGCGRVARWWSALDGPAVYGCDPNRELVAWTRGNLPFVNAAYSDDDPPLPYPDDTFEFIYALSIFTHLAERHALPWLAELRRVLKPGGHLLFTVCGEAYRDKLTPEDAARYDGGEEEVVQFETARGTNLCIAYHSPAYVRGRLLDGFDYVDSVLTPEHPEQTAATRMPQDSYLVRAAA